MVQDYEHLTSPHWLLQPEPGWVQAVYLGWVTFECQRALSRRLSLCILQAAVAVHFSLKMINVRANYQRTGTHSSIGDGNQEIVIWRTRSFWLWYYFALISFHLADAYLLFNLPAVLAVRLFYAFIYLSGLWHTGPTEVKRCFSQGCFGCRNLSFHNLPTVNQTALSSVPPLIPQKSQISHYLRDNSVTMLNFNQLESSQSYWVIWNGRQAEAMAFHNSFVCSLQLLECVLLIHGSMVFPTFIKIVCSYYSWY